ncbi:hypothetical protein ACFL2V_13920 [Pseudomonadota bacterium]
MSMFLEPLHNDQDETLVAHLITLHNAFHEFGTYCSFLHQAHEGIVAQAELDQNTSDGISMSGRCLVTRSQALEQRLTEVLALAKRLEPTRAC